ncbi:HEAT repeat-containing protein 5A [Orchesella cincta]|uniref:HEAT repeat-containing protein 5A n=1 Tax=Orchesella cincta TaxID=48709 RepID=A0A1D2M7W8_ORCCI|nr:HEAT repeat-containing protein 5A [Orchesella cincta]
MHRNQLKSAAGSPLRAADVQKPIFILEWLRHVETVLSCISRIELKASQKQLVDQLLLKSKQDQAPQSEPRCPMHGHSFLHRRHNNFVRHRQQMQRPPQTLKDDSPSIKLAACPARVHVLPPRSDDGSLLRRNSASLFQNVSQHGIPIPHRNTDHL